MGRDLVIVSNLEDPLHVLHVLIDAIYLFPASFVIDHTDAQPIRFINGPTGLANVIGCIAHPLLFQEFTVALLSELVIGGAANDLVFTRSKASLPILCPTAPRTCKPGYSALALHGPPQRLCHRQ
ncbi:MAG: hypothetical protein JSW35_07280 [Deltaproteobacteria bacterium]|nr:MAG: hypothetical protein JSW35_07280 [Deltaproteobacteria bacterium]